MIKNVKKIIMFLYSVIFCTVIAIGMPQMARAVETETFTGASGKSGDLEWNITAEGHLTIQGIGNYKKNVSHNNLPEWLEYKEYIKTAKIDIQNITSTTHMLYQCVNLIQLDMNNLNTNQIIDMSYMFSGCENLNNLDISNVNVSNVNTMRGMFCNCTNLINLDISNFNTSKVTDMSYMFYNCNNLISLDIANFNTSEVTKMSSMFCHCTNLINLDISNFNTNNVINMRNMFNECSSLTNLNLSNLDTSKVTDMCQMFYNCNNLVNLDISNFDTSKVTNMTNMFRNCNSLISLDISNFNTSEVIKMNSMFSDCNNLANLDISVFNTSKVVDMTCMFNKCSNLVSLDLSNFDTSKVTNMRQMFSNCNNLVNLNISVFDTSKVIDMSYMFNQCSNLISLNLNNFDTAKVTNMKYMFKNCNSLTSLNISNFNTSSIKYGIFEEAVNLHIEYGTFDLNDLVSLEKLYFFANSSQEYDLPSSTGYRWINESNATCTKTAKIDRKMTYTRVDGDYITPSTPSSAIHIFHDYNYTSPVSGSAIVIYGNGANLTIDDKKVNNKVFTAYTDIIASYKHTPNNNGTVKSLVGKVIVAVTKTNVKPEVNSKNKVTDTSASKIAKAKIKNGQITVTAVGKEGGLVYLWVIDTGNKGVYECCPINVQLAPKKLEVQDTSGNKLKNTKLANGKILNVCIAGIVSGSTKTYDCTYTATVDAQYQSYVTITPIEGSTNKFTINAKGLKNNKDTKAAITFKCDQNGKKTKFSLTITQ